MRVKDHADSLNLCISGKAGAISLSCKIDWSRLKMSAVFEKKKQPLD
jgi:hypothetical protein